MVNFCEFYQKNLILKFFTTIFATVIEFGFLSRLNVHLKSKGIIVENQNGSQTKEVTHAVFH